MRGKSPIQSNIFKLLACSVRHPLVGCEKSAVKRPNMKFLYFIAQITEKTANATNDC